MNDTKQLLTELQLLEGKILRLKETNNTRDYSIFITNYQTSILWLKEHINNSAEIKDI